ncbi:ADP-ribosylglycohydrolase family protein [Desulfococcus sp.]|uniref:ADP-ribosylglycohydrolase family protein n=1 Tax=Desulfococcus sp. TaxID=2025834 RepID=UPI0035930FF1
MIDNRKAAVLASFAADSLALGAHWIYDTDEIAARFGRVTALEKPGPDSYHTTKEKGEFTHYGDQMLVLLTSLAEQKRFDLEDFSRRWRKLFEHYDGYMDGAAKKTLAYYEKGKTAETAGSHTGDFGGASRMAPLVGLLGGDPDGLAEAARAQARMTHDDPNTLDTADFFARVTAAVLNGASPTAAIEEIAASEAFEMTPVAMWVEEGLKSRNEESVSAVAKFGQACETPQVFPGVVHLIARYEADLKEALIQAVMAGGDSAARGSMTGMVLAAHLGMDAIPREWTEGMKKAQEILSLLEKIAG